VIFAVLDHLELRFCRFCRPWF